MCSTNQICRWSMKSTQYKLSAGNMFTFFQHEQQQIQQKCIFLTLFGRRFEKTEWLNPSSLPVYDLDHVKAMQKIPWQINRPFTCEHDTQAEGHRRCKRSKAWELHTHMSGGTKISLKTISQGKKSLLCCDTIDTFLRPSSLSDNHTATESLFELTDKRRNPN